MQSAAWTRSASTSDELPRPPRGAPRGVHPPLQHDPHQRHQLLPRRRGLAATSREEVLPAAPARRSGRARSGSGAPAAPPARRPTRWPWCWPRRIGVDEFRERVKIYATDVDEEALTQARHGDVLRAGARGASRPSCRERYFEPRRGRATSSARSCAASVIFGRNDLVQDAPISHVDLLICRNTLMYFNAETQAQILNRLHFALRPDGVLFLGKAEMLLEPRRLVPPGRAQATVLRRRSRPSRATVARS